LLLPRDGPGDTKCAMITFNTNKELNVVTAGLNDDVHGGGCFPQQRQVHLQPRSATKSVVRHGLGELVRTWAVLAVVGIQFIQNRRVFKPLAKL
jgi:hypothetical protein